MNVRVLSFTGSGRTGRLIQEVAARTNLKKIVLKIGRKSPAIIFEDMGIPSAAREVARSIQWNSRQVCIASSQVYVQKSVVSAFLDTYTTCLRAVRIGDLTEESVSHGPQAADTQYDSILEYIQDGKLTTTYGYFIEPTVFVDTPEDARVMKEEIFGPVVNVNTLETGAEVVEKANATEFGLYASVFTNYLDRAVRLAKALECG
ncbi:aldehyde dehydrogenase domain-containing protein [Aspergillus germanicus]